MNRFWGAPIAVLLVATPMAAADDSAVVSTLDVTATNSTSENVEPDWYKQFTLADRDYIKPEAAPEGVLSKDFQLQWNTNGRWALTFDMSSRDESSPLPREEMAAGATFQITPRLSVGGDVSVGAEELNSASDLEDQDVEAGIRLRSAFRF